MDEKKFITEYEEFGGEGGKIGNHFVKLPEDKKSKVLSYLKSFKPEAIRCSLIKDYVKGFQTKLSIYVYSDGEYDWADDEIYHFENYDIELNPDFVEKVLRFN